MLAAGTAALTIACASRLPEPEAAEVPAHAFVEVPSFPPPARVEIVPNRPRRDAVWIDGEWEWDGRQWSWKCGRWVAMPGRLFYARWALVRRKDGTLLLAPGVWRDAVGRDTAPPPVLAIGRAADDIVVGPEGNRERTGPNIEPEMQ